MSSLPDDNQNKDMTDNIEETPALITSDETSADSATDHHDTAATEVAYNGISPQPQDPSTNGGDMSVSGDTPEITINLPNPEHKKKKRKYTLLIFIVAIAALIAALLIFSLPLLYAGASENAVIKIPVNATTGNVHDSIAKYLGEEYAGRVMRVATLRGSDFSGRHGAYLIEQGTSPLRAERKLTTGAQYPLTITINGFRTLPTLTERIVRRLDFPYDSLASLLSDPEVLRPYSLTPRQAIALFIDDSYELYWSTSPQQLINKVGAHYNEVWNEERRAKAAALGLTPAQVMTLCSIVDEESNKLDEKGKIGRLYINRINTGMPLQADPTVRYALNDFTIRRVKGSHLKTESPYNTYLNRGLPPGPIRTTGVATIDAVLNSEPSSHLYMCAREDFSGYHNFASSYPEHLANARRYQKALDARGIK